MADPASFFSSNYTEARAKFLGAASNARMPIETHVLPNFKGPAGEELATDVGVLGAKDADAGLVLISATHGAEGFCGSGCQTGLLEEGRLHELSEKLRVLVVHAHNPYGFAWLRRVNEDNVDLNRNYVDHTRPYPANADYDELAAAIAPQTIEGPEFDAANQRLLDYSKRHGAFGLQAAMTRGQFNHPHGLYYGGNGPTWSNRTLTAAFERHLAHQRFIAVVDFHTGLGPHGHGEIINEFDPGSPGDLRIEKWFSGEAKSTRRGESVSAELFGTVDGAMQRLLPWAQATAFALEYGTVSANEVLAATRADHWLHRHGDLASPLGKRIKYEIRRVFYPDTDEWKRLVWARAVDIVARTAKGVLEEAGDE